MNDTLPRCKKGIFVVINKFLKGIGRCTLLGQFSRTWLQHCDTLINWKADTSSSLGDRCHHLLSLTAPFELVQP